VLLHRKFFGDLFSNIIVFSDFCSPMISVLVKESTRALQETVERLAKQLERENSKVDSLEQEREELRRSNSTLTAELSKVGSLSFLGADNC
jgi:septal ring factor EnvC (AmiA/AmiB activator)